jgi:pimeloyl-ACP methyl ester carboxylesterase
MPTPHRLLAALLRLLLASTPAVPTASILAQPSPAAPVTPADTAIRPFRVHVPRAALTDLRQRIRATRWPEPETVPDRTQGIQRQHLQDLLQYWGSDYSWRQAEAKLNAYPQFITRIDGLDIHFLHVRSKHPNALPLLITHGWPGSVFEMLGAIGPLTNPTAYGGKAEDAFDVIIPSLPGYGFSGKPTGPGWNPDHVAQAWATLMRRLGYTRYVAQGGDWGAPVSHALARLAPAGLRGIHVSLPAAVPADVAAMRNGGPELEGRSEAEQTAARALDRFYNKNRAYSVLMATRPQMIGYSLTDSPAGLAAWMLDYNEGEPERLLSRDQLLDNITLYWLTNTAASAARLYWENNGRGIVQAEAQRTADITLPVAVTVFPQEIYRAPESWVRRAYPSLSYFHEAARGGHFAAWEQPELFTDELRAAFRPLR